MPEEKTPHPAFARLLLGIIAFTVLPPSIGAPTSSKYDITPVAVGRRDGADFFSEASLTTGTCSATDNLKSYTPYVSPCPGDDFEWIRPADSLSSSEKKYLEARRPKLQASWDERMKMAELSNPLPRLPVVAMALSGGGYRAFTSGSGMAFQQNNTAGSAGDILALSSYVAGLSGGSWALTSFYANNGLSPDQLAKTVCNLPTMLDSCH
jgi:lysophospholipase